MKYYLRHMQKFGSVLWATSLFFIATNGYSQNTGLSASKFKPIYSNVIPICSCEDLAKVNIPNTIIKSVIVDPKGDFCQVTSIVTHHPANDSIKIWIRLPLKNWNGRFYGTGGGGFVGGMIFNLQGPASQGFAVGATNAGHDVLNGSFALNTFSHCLNWQGISDFAYLGIHDMTIVGKALVQTFYGKPARYSYFVGGSNGGRQALTEAQRFPEDYDGISSSCPAIYWTRVLTGDLWPQAVMNDAKNYVSKEKLAAVTKAAINACDHDDGVVDGVINNPTGCMWDPQSFVGIKIGESTFTEADADVVKKIWEGPRTHEGKFLWYGMPIGSNLFALAGSTGDPAKGAPNAIFLEWARYFLLTNPNWDISSLSCSEFELLWNQAVEQYSEVFYAENPDLQKFRDHGGKLLIYHGLADELVPPQGTIDYYEQLKVKMGGPKAVSKFARLFLFPGLSHGFMGAGSSPVGQFDAIVKWVEEGKAPDQIMTEKHDGSGKTVRTRPVFPYPEITKFKGSGSTDDASSFIKRSPTH